MGRVDPGRARSYITARVDNGFLETAGCVEWQSELFGKVIVPPNPFTVENANNL
jgi:hypothetical protein